MGLVAFFTSFCYQISNIFISNIIFVLVVLLRCRNVRSIGKHVKIRKWPAIFFAIYMVAVTVSTAVYYSFQSGFNLRNLFQYCYNFQYLFLVVDIDLDYKKFRQCFIAYVKLLAGVICVMSISYLWLNQLPLDAIWHDRMWAAGFIPSWPNGTGLVLVFGFYMLYQFDRSIWEKLLLAAAAVLTTSRMALLSVVIIAGYFEVVVRLQKSKMPLKKKLLFVGGAVVVVAVGAVIFDSYFGGLFYRLFSNGDRYEIMQVTMEFFVKRPVLGFGGNTIDMIEYHFGLSQYATTRYGHAHNTLYELMLRYGILGTVPFFAMVIARIPRIKNTNNRLMYCFLWCCSLVQVYFRSFVFMMMLLYLLQDKDIPQGRRLPTENEKRGASMNLSSLMEKWDQIAYRLYDGMAWVKYAVDRPSVAKALKKNEDCKDAYKGKRCFIVLNGPSINEHDLTPLKNEYVFAVNHMFMADEMVDKIHPDFYCWTDSGDFVPERKDVLDAALAKCPYSQFFFNVKYLNLVEELPENVRVTYAKHMPHTGKVRNDLSGLCSNFMNVGMYTLNVALYLGFSEIYFLGLDFTPGHFTHFSDKLAPATDPNLFQEKNKVCGLHWDYSLAQYQTFYMRTLADKMGRKVINLNRKSHVQAFPFGDFEDLF